MIFPKAHTACSQTFWWGECSSLRKSGTASEKYKQKSMQLLRNISLKRQNSWHTLSLNKISDCKRNFSLCWVLVKTLTSQIILKYVTVYFSSHISRLHSASFDNPYGSIHTATAAVSVKAVILVEYGYPILNFKSHFRPLSFGCTQFESHNPTYWDNLAHHCRTGFKCCHYMTKKGVSWLSSNKFPNGNTQTPQTHQVSYISNSDRRIILMFKTKAEPLFKAHSVCTTPHLIN